LVANFAQVSVDEYKYVNETTNEAQDVIPLVLPAYHIYGLSFIALLHLSFGVKLVTLKKFSSQSYFDMIMKHNPAILFVVPPIVLMMLNNSEFDITKVSNLRMVGSGAAPLGSSDVERFNDKSKGKVTFIQMYGMTETSPITHGQTWRIENGLKIGGCGFPVPNTECKFVGLNDETFTPLPANENGELLVRGPQIMKGYLNNQEATANTITPDGWLRTGDIGHYDEDGHFFITDRLKELIKVSGYQVPPAELEELLRDHPDVKEAAVIGVPDAKKGEAPKAFIVLNAGAKSTSEDIFKYAAEKTVKYKHLTGGVVIIDAIPKTPSGKILRRDLKKL